MYYSSKKVRELVDHYKKISVLGKISGVLGWDLSVNLPQKASEGRAIQSAHLSGLLADEWQDTHFVKLLLDVATTKDKLEPHEVAMLRNLTRASRFYRKVPKELIVEMTKTTSEGYMVWQKAKTDNVFADFLPYLSKIVKLNQLTAEHLGFEENSYDALLDLYEPGLTVKEIRNVFTQLVPAIKILIKQIQGSKNYQEESNLIGLDKHYPIDRQKQLAKFVLTKMNYDFGAGRMDTSSHPFTTELGRYDVRITTRYNQHDFLDSLTAAIHEGGHAVYEQGVNPEYETTPLEGGVSLGIHESQSRFWENQVGRSTAFLSFLTPVLQAFYPEYLAKTTEQEIVQLFNLVKPGMIRVDADEVTYNLHIAIRFELEDALLNNKLTAKELPEAWRQKMKEYLGVAPATDREGVLQDVHWSHGSFGYFPTYTLGNLYAAQFTHIMTKSLHLDDLLAKGNLGIILSWLRDNIHKHGSLFWPDELVKRVTKETLNPQYFIDYLEKKYGEIYQLV